MAINTRKISGLSELSTLSGEEYLLVAKNNRSYKAKAELFTSDKIDSITQTVAKGDDAISNITISTSSGQDYVFSVKNGSKGSDGNQGIKGEKGETGDSGIIRYNTDPTDVIIDSLDGKDNEGNVHTDDELASMILSARQGNVLNGKIEALEEEYVTQEEYDARVESGNIKEHVKYFIIESEE